jgi:hypothetical protein
MGIIIKISSKKRPEEIQKALQKLSEVRGRKKKKLVDFYGKIANLYGNGLDYQKKVRNDW